MQNAVAGISNWEQFLMYESESEIQHEREAKYGARSGMRTGEKGNTEIGNLRRKDGDAKMGCNIER
jgi:hypothetical protein